MDSKHNAVLKSIFIGTFILGSFLFLSYFFVYPLLVKGFVSYGDDITYQVQRILELSHNLKHGIFLPFVYTYSFGQVAFPLGIFYPEITLIPSALLFNIFNHQVTGIYAGIAFYALLTMIFTYIIFRKLNHSWVISYIAAILYTFSVYHTIDAFTRFAMGEYIAMTFLPVAFYGFYAILKGKVKEWPYLAFGLSFILLSHVLSTFIVVLTMAVIWLLSFLWKSNHFQSIRYLAIAGIAALFSSAIFWVPFVEQQLFQKYNQPSPISMENSSTNLSDLLISAINNSMIRPYSIGLTMLLTLIFGGVFFRKLNQLEKYSYLIATFIFVGSSAVFPWVVFQKTPISVIQYSFRLFMISTLFFTVVAAGLLRLFIQNNTMTSIMKQLSLVFLVLLILGSWSQSMQKLRINPLQNVATKIFTNSGPQSKNPNNSTFVEQYTPRKTMPHFKELIDHVAIINHKKVTLTRIVAKPSKQIYTEKSVVYAKKVDLPVSYYKNFVAYRNGKQVSTIRSSRNTLLVNSNTTGPITVTYKYSVIDKFSFLASIASWIVFLVFFCFQGFQYMKKRWSSQKPSSK